MTGKANTRSTRLSGETPRWSPECGCLGLPVVADFILAIPGTRYNPAFDQPWIWDIPQPGSLTREDKMGSRMWELRRKLTCRSGWTCLDLYCKHCCAFSRGSTSHFSHSPLPPLYTSSLEHDLPDISGRLASGSRLHGASIVLSSKTASKQRYLGLVRQ